jgi:hypothetical protein
VWKWVYRRLGHGTKFLLLKFNQRSARSSAYSLHYFPVQHQHSDLDPPPIGYHVSYHLVQRYLSHSVPTSKMDSFTTAMAEKSQKKTTRPQKEDINNKYANILTIQCLSSLAEWETLCSVSATWSIISYINSSKQQDMQDFLYTMGMLQYQLPTSFTTLTKIWFISKPSILKYRHKCCDYNGIFNMCACLIIN